MTSATFVVRVWIPDRPGALGQVASRIGSVRGDVVGIEILERGAGRAIDEIVVELEDSSLVEAMVREINEVDGVDVEEIRAVAGGHIDPWLDALDTAAQLVGAHSAVELLEALVDHAYRGTGASWAAVVQLDAAAVLVSRGPIPDRAWLQAFLAGSRLAARSGGAHGGAARDVTWAPLPAANMAVIVGRDGTAFRAKERHQVAALARIADAWLSGLEQISDLNCRLAHPSFRAAPSAGNAPPRDARN